MPAELSHSLRTSVHAIHHHSQRLKEGGKAMFSRRAHRVALITAACLVPGWATAQLVTSFTVVNADTGADIANIPVGPTGGAVSGSVSIASTPRINVRVNANGVKSVVFADGGGTRTESSAPYAYKGNSGAVYTKWQPVAGSYDISATPYAAAGGSGLAGPKATLKLTVTGGTSPPPVASDKPANRNEAARFLSQATFGPTDQDITDLMNDGYTTWIEKQFIKPTSESHLDFFTRVLDSNGQGNDKEVVATFWKQVLKGEDQLRLRMAYALSQIFVISLNDGDVDNYDRAVAQWLDMLKSHSFGNYRDLLQSVSVNPMMGIYLSHLANQKADSVTGRVPDENYAREVMQLFSIGLVELNLDGSPRLDGSSKPIETYSPKDVSELAKVFTGWSWDCPVPTDKGCFLRGKSYSGNKEDPSRDLKPMVPYTAYHSAEPKSFLKLQIAANTGAQKSLTDALNHLAAHDNVAPFISKQLIQRFTTSNPSPAYVKAVANKFNNNGAGVRGDFKAVLKEVLLHPEARTRSTTSGKVREPVLRLAAFMRAFAHDSDSKRYELELTDSAATALGQAPLSSPSVFNFYRPGYVAPGITATNATNGPLVAPELQILNETSAAGYVNFMRDSISNGVGFPAGSGLTRRDIKSEYKPELLIAHDAPALVDRVTQLLTYGVFSAPRRKIVIDAVESIAIPAGNATATQVKAAKQQRVNAAILLTVASPEFIVTE
jgi:uncharacterized protein (DUF1800 family)